MISNNQKDFLISALTEHSIRVDGRRPENSRKLVLNILQGTDQYGHTEVVLGNTKVIACVSANLGAPYPEKPTEGTLIFNVEFSPMTTSKLSDEQIQVNRFLERVYIRSRAIDTEGLCVVAGEHVWNVRIDVHVIEDDGNVLDASSIAVTSSLLHFRRKDVTIDGDGQVVVWEMRDKLPVPIALHFLPLTSSFCFFTEKSFVLDPCRIEEQCRLARFVLAPTNQGDICSMSATTIGNQMFLTKEQIINTSKMARNQVAEWLAIIEKTVKLDLNKRK